MRASHLAALVPLVVVAAGAAAATTWEDVSAAAGVAFQQAGETHPEGEDTTWPVLAEIMGAGSCWLDYDADGYDDLYLVSQQFNPMNPGTEGWLRGVSPTSKLYRSDGDGTFTDVTREAGVEAAGIWGTGCSSADYDGDGCVDLFVGGFGLSLMYRNGCDGTFVNATSDLGVSLGGGDRCGIYPCYATSSAWADYDRDGDLDLYVATYVETNLTDPGRGPRNHTAQLNWLLRNNGDGTFDDVAWDAGASGNPSDAFGAKSLGVVWSDYDLDGWPDLFVANDQTPLYLFHNNRDGTFHERAQEARIADSRSNMGVAARDYDNDGYPDFFTTHYMDEDEGFYRNLQDGTFQDRSGEDDLNNSWPYVGWGTDFVDVNRDGWLDIVEVNGHTEWVLDYDQPNEVYLNRPEEVVTEPGDRRWVDASPLSGSGITDERVHRSAAFADYDYDGNIDIAIVNNANQSAQLLRGGGNANRWLNVRLAQPGMNPSAVGARLVLEAGGMKQFRELQAGNSFLSQSSLAVDFGLGTASQAERLTVQWPDGATTTLGPIAANQTIRIDRATGTFVNDTVSPFTRAVFEGREGENGWWRGPVEGTLDAQDRGTPWPSGLAATEYALGPAPWEPYDGAAFRFDGDGPHTVRMRSTDALGNREPVRSETVRIDATDPVTWHVLDGVQRQDGWFPGSVRVRINASDAMSGVETLRYRLDRGPWLDYRWPVRVSGEGVHELDYYAKDRAGNHEFTFGVMVRIDATPPRVALTKPGPGSVVAHDLEAAQLGFGPAVVVAPAAQGITVTADASDALSGVAQVELWVDGARVGVDAEAPFEWTWDARAAGHGMHAVRAVARDLAGNEAEHGLSVLVVDPRPPPFKLALGWATDALRWRPWATATGP